MLKGLVVSYSTFPNVFPQSDPRSNIPSPASNSAIHMIILRDEKEGQREIQMMILEERNGERDGCCHRCAPMTPPHAEVICVHVVVCVCVCVCTRGNMRIDAEA